MEDQKKTSEAVEQEKAAMESEFAGLDQITQSVAQEEIDPEVKAEPQIDENIDPSIETAEVETKEPQADENADASVITDEIRAAARVRGFTDDDIAKFASSENLDAAFSVLDRRAAAFGHDAMKAQSPPQKAATEPVQEVKKADVPAKEAEVSVPELELKKLKDIEEDYPEIVESFREMSSVLRAQSQKIARLETELEKPVKEIVQRSRQEVENNVRTQVDNLFASEFAKEYEEFVGKGGYNDMPPDSDARKIRDQILMEMNAMAIGHQQIGIPFQGLEYLFKRALPAILADKIKSRAVQEASQKINDRRKTFSARPGNRPSANGKIEKVRIGDVVDDEELLAMSGLPD